jgi:hypothetical protein
VVTTRDCVLSPGFHATLRLVAVSGGRPSGGSGASSEALEAAVAEVADLTTQVASLRDQNSELGKEVATLKAQKRVLVGAVPLLHTASLLCVCVLGGFGANVLPCSCWGLPHLSPHPLTHSATHTPGQGWVNLVEAG